MIRKVLLFLFFFVTISFVFSAKQTFACTGLSVNPQTGPQGTSFVGTASGCNTGFNDYAIWMTYPDGSRLALGTLLLNNDGTANFPIGGNPSAIGTYTLQIDLRLDTLVTTTFEVTENEEEEVPTQRPYYCGETVPFNVQTCSAENPVNCCPSICPTSTEDGLFFCKIETPYVCSATEYSSGDDSVGINSPIGCIPVGKADYLASFFLKWSTGILGGIGLLMIIWGSYQVITSQGDSRKVQAGKELITASVSAILFLLFSVFIFRIIATQILQIL